MTILCLSPHTDDCEISAGGLMDKYCKEGDHLINVAFSSCENPALPDEFRRSSNILANESILFDYPRRQFQRDRQEILDTMIELRKKYNPQIVLTPSSGQVHQDHQVIHEETKRAFRCQIYGYEQVWNSTTQTLTAYAALTPGNLANKLTALSLYESQKDRLYFNPSFISSMAMVRGVQFGVPMAEAFEVIRATL